MILCSGMVIIYHKVFVKLDAPVRISVVEITSHISLATEKGDSID